jgi:hypothetical protein
MLARYENNDKVDVAAGTLDPHDFCAVKDDRDWAIELDAY